MTEQVRNRYHATLPFLKLTHKRQHREKGHHKVDASWSESSVVTEDGMGDTDDAVPATIPVYVANVGRPVVSLCQLVHSCWVDVVDLARCAYDGAAATGLSIYNCLGLREGLGLRSLDVHTADLVHQRREVLRAVRGNDLSADLLQCVLGQRCLQHG